MTDLNNKIFKFIIRLPKAESAFFYFTLEANEGLCFYSTLDQEEGLGYRDIEIQGDYSLLKEFQAVLSPLLEQCSGEIIYEQS